MNIINHPSVEIWTQPTSGDIMTDMYKHIERCGRVCYHSLDRKTDTSYNKFIDIINTNKHYSVFAHGTLYLTIFIPYYKDNDTLRRRELVDFFTKNKYSVVNMDRTPHEKYYITTNYRVIVEHDMLDKIQEFITQPTEFHERRISVFFSSNIGVSREFNRHSVNSISEESTRYCNYTKDKFNNEIKYAKSSWINENSESFNEKQQWPFDAWIYEYMNNNKQWTAIDWWLFALSTAETSYMKLIELGWTPEQARVVLNLETGTSFVHTATVSDWKHFLDLRYYGVTGKPHPDAFECAQALHEKLLLSEYGDYFKNIQHIV